MDNQTKPERIQKNMMALKPMHMHTGSYSHMIMSEQIQDEQKLKMQEALSSHRTQQSQDKPSSIVFQVSHLSIYTLSQSNPVAFKLR